MKNLILFFSLVFVPPISFASVSMTLDKEASSAEFLAIGKPSAIKIRGNKGKPEGKLTYDGTGVKGEINLNLSDFETGIALRDRHMKEKYLEVDKGDNKVSKLTITKISLPTEFWKAPGAQKTTFTGKLKLHGVEKDVTGDVDISDASKQSLAGIAKFTISLPDYGITIPSFSGITVAEKVDVEIKFRGKLESL